MPAILTVNDLRKTYPKASQAAVDGVSFSVEAGSIFAFLGPNGAGKTTTIKMLTTLLKPTSGDMRVNGFDPLREQDAVRSSIGIVFQDSSIDDELTAYENMEIHGVLYGVPRAVRQARTKELLQIVELWDRKDDYLKNFSGGMKRRLEIARGLLHHPQILFLDEPTIGLDPQTRNHIWNYVADLNRREGITVFLTTHYMDEVERVSSQVAIVDHGRIVAEGTIASIRDRTGKSSLEDAFIELTGHGIRDEQADGTDRMRQFAFSRQRR